jgi:fibronectin type 3 domain-containing protein
VAVRRAATPTTACSWEDFIRKSLPAAARWWLRGHGGGTGTSSFNRGVYLDLGKITSAGTGADATVTVRGFGGNTTGSGGNNDGVYVSATGAQITSSGGAVLVQGTGGGAGSSSFNYGVIVGWAGVITSAGPSATVTVEGQGGSSIGSENHGVFVSGTNSRIASSGGNIEVVGTPGGGTGQFGIQIASNGQIQTSFGTPSVTLVADTMDFSSTTSVDAGSNRVTLRPETPGRSIDLGGADSTTQLGITNDEFNRLTAGTLIIGSDGSLDYPGVATGVVTVSSGIAPTNASALAIVTARNIAVNANVTGGPGGLTLRANMQPAPTAENFIGIDVNGATIASGSGAITLAGRGGDDAAGNQHGVRVRSAGVIGGGTIGAVAVQGFGGASTNNGNYGVLVTGSGSQIMSSGGAVLVEGTGGSGSGNDNHGVMVWISGEITSGGTGTVTVTGTGGSGSGSSNYGMYVVSPNSRITSGGGDVNVTGQGGGGAGSGNGNYGVYVSSSGEIKSGGAGTVTVTGIGGSGSGNQNHGVQVQLDSAVITSGGAGAVMVTGTGGSGSGSSNWGVFVASGNSRITSGGGHVDVTGHGGGAAGSGGSNYGVYVTGSGEITSSGSGTVTVTGTGGAGSGGGQYGIHVDSSGEITSGGSGAVTVNGTGGSGSGSANVGVSVSGANSRIASSAGDVDVTGHGGGGAGNGNFNHGVLVSSSGEITSGGSGTVAVTGTGGSGGGGFHRGVVVSGTNSRITSGGLGMVTITGTGGSGSGSNNYGVEVSSSGKITSGDGDVDVTGQGGGGSGSGSSNFGVYVDSSGEITSGGTGTVTVTGSGGSGSGVNNWGVFVVSVNSQITSNGGAVMVTATGNTNTNPAEALRLASSGSIASGSNAPIIIRADSVNLPSGTSIDSGAGTTTIRPRTAGTQIDLGGANVLSGSPLVLGLTDAELDRITAGKLVIGSADSGAITVTSNISRPAATDIDLQSTAGITVNNGVDLNSAGGTVSPIGNSTLTVNGSVTGPVVVPAGSSLLGSGTINGNVSGTGFFSPGNSPGVMMINGDFTPAGTVNFEVNSAWTTAGTHFDQYVVSGAVDLSGATITFTNNDDAAAPAANSLIKLIDKTSDGATVASSSPAQGATVTIGSRSFRIFYNGGDGSDVVLVEASTPMTVYVEDTTWNSLTPGTVIADADFGLSGNQPAIFGVTAFTTITDALAAVSSSGTVIVNDGTYAETVSLGGTRTLRIGGVNVGQEVAIEDLAGVAGTTINIAGSSTLTAGAKNSSTTFAGSISGTGHLTKTGSGTFTLSGVNTYSGATTVNAGRLDVLGAITSDVSVHASGVLGGSGAIHGAVAVHSGGTVEPGVSPGVLHTGDIAFASGATFAVELDGTAAGGGHDQLQVAGSVQLDQATLTLTGAHVPSSTAPESFVIIDNGSSDPVSGHFYGLPEGSVVMLNGQPLWITYRGGDGNDVVLMSQGVFGSIRGMKFHDRDGDGIYEPPATAPDNGSGTVDLPVPGAAFTPAGRQTLLISDGLPAGTTIEARARLDGFHDVVQSPSGLPDSTEEQFAATLTLHLRGTGTLSGWARTVTLPVSVATFSGPRISGEPVQSFDTELIELQGQIAGDPDFDWLQITAGAAFSLPSPGHTTLTQLPEGDWAVDSFFDITYRIDFAGAPGGVVAGSSGSSTGAVRLGNSGDESPLSSIRFDLLGDVDGDGVPDTVTVWTDSDGQFHFGPLYPGEYLVQEMVPSGMAATTPTTVTLTVGPGEDLVWRPGAAMLPEDSPRSEVLVGPALTFGNVILGSIEGFKFEDRNGDGAYRPLVVAWDDGEGTASLPVRDVPFRSEDGQMVTISDGLPDGATLEGGAKWAVSAMTKILLSDDSSLGGSSERFRTDLILDLHGTGAMAGWQRTVSLYPLVQTDHAPRTPWDPVQSFASDLFELEDELTDDPDFDLFRITAGTGLGLPSPGHTTLTQLPDGNWAVDSFFDITYQIEFIGAPDGPLAGMAGTTIGTIRMTIGGSDLPWEGIPFQLIGDVDGDGTIDVLWTSTDANGEFWFEDLYPGEYMVVEGALPAGTVSTTPSSATLTVGSGERFVWREDSFELVGTKKPVKKLVKKGSLIEEVPTNGLMMFGNAQLGEIRGFKFEDLNGNGIWDEGEPGVAGWPITLTGVTGMGWPVVQTAVTMLDDPNTPEDETGMYRFTGLWPGEYHVDEGQMTPWVQSHGVGGYDATLVSGQTLEHLDFGNYVPGSIHGYKFRDLNGNGQDDDEPRWAGVLVTLTGDVDGDGLPETVTTYTDADGRYAFTGLHPGAYTVTETPPPGSEPTTADSVTVTVASGQQLVAEAGQSGLNSPLVRHEFTGTVLSVQPGWDQLVPVGSGISGFFVYDRSRPDAGIGSTEGVYRLNPPVPFGPSRVMMTAGGVSFVNNLAERLQFVVFDNYVYPGGTPFDSFYLGSFQAMMASPAAAMPADLSATGINLSFILEDSSATAFSSDALPLSLDASAFDTFIGFVDGYSYSAGSTRFTYQLDSLQAIPLESYETVNTALAFGNRLLGEIRGVKFEDWDGDGFRDAGEPGLEGWTIFLDIDGDEIADLSTETLADGSYSFEGLPPGSYTVWEESRAGWGQSEPTGGSHALTLGIGQVLEDVDFGNWREGAIRGFKFEDVDADGQYTAGVDRPLSGIEVILSGTSGLGQPVAGQSAVTAADGTFAFTGLAPGHYQLEELVPAGWIASTPAMIGFVPGSIGSESAWQNPANSLDVNQDGFVTLLDALILINDLNENGSRELPETKPVEAFFLDVNGDGSVSRMDLGFLLRHLDGHGMSQLPVDLSVLSGQELIALAGQDGESSGEPSEVIVLDSYLMFGNHPEFDFGDAPDDGSAWRYPTLLANDGARHRIVHGFHLGTSVDGEHDGQPTLGADGDDLDGHDDEDGVTFLTGLVRGTTAQIEVVASAPGLLNAWLDFNGDGDWADAGEQIFVDQALVAGVNSLSFAVPWGEFRGATYARFRFDSGGGLSYDGLAADGEVEDYRVEIEFPNTRRFDFNAPGSPTQALLPADPSAVTYTGVLPTNAYSSNTGFGWLGAPSHFDRGASASPAYSSLLRDGAWGSGASDFQMLLAPGSYEVTVTLGDPSFARDRMNVTVVQGSGDGLTNVATAAGQLVHRSFTASPDADGVLKLRFSDSGGDPYWTAGAVEVRPAAAAVNVARDGGDEPQPADGVTVDTFTVSGATAGAWYTLSIDRGTVTTVDQDPRYAGVQVQAPGESFAFTVLRGTGGGTANVRVEEVNGASRGSVTQPYLAVLRYDFNNGSSPTADGFVGVGSTNAYDPLLGYGWAATASTFSRGIGDPLLRDGHWGTDNTFQVQVPDGTYVVNVTLGDASFARNFINVELEGTAPASLSGLSSAAGQFVHASGQVTVDDGYLNVRVRSTGGDPYFTINALEIFEVDLPEAPRDHGLLVDAEAGKVSGTANPGALVTVRSDRAAIPTNQDANSFYAGVQVQADAVTGEFEFAFVPPPGGGAVEFTSEEVTGRGKGTASHAFALTGWRFDFNSDTSPIADGFIGLGATNAYSAVSGFGWQSNASAFNRGIANDLLRDGHWGTNNTFNVNVPDGDYLVNVTLGDASFARNNISVWAEGILQHSGLATAAGQFLHRSFVVTVNDGQLNVQIASTGGDPYFTVNALEVFPAPDPPRFDHDLQTADGVTFTGTSNAPDGSLVTVSTSLGSITSADANPDYAGVQVVVNSGSFSFTVAGPGGGGSATITSEEVTGQGWDAVVYSYAVPDVRRFDFNGSGNDTELTTTPVFTGVRGSQLYDANNGYGWTQTVSEFQRGSAAKTSVALYRDGHWGSAVRTFQVAVVENTAYNVRVYVGDPSFARNNIQISVEGGSWQNVANTAANEFATLVVPGTSSDSDGLLSISIRNNGGDPYWVVNGFDVWETTATDPAEAPLLAGVWSNEMVGDWLTEAAVEAVLPAAREYWVSTGLADWQLTQLYHAPISIGDLSYRGALGVSRPEGIWLDASGAGLGWNTSLLAPNSQLLASSYDLLTVLTHELGHVLGYDDLDPQQYPDHIMAGVLQPGTGRIEIAAGGHGPQWVAGAERDSEGGALIGPAAGGRGPLLSGRGVLVDRVLDDLLRDDLRVSRDAWQNDEDEEFERLLTSRSSERHDETDDFFAQL